MNHFLKPDTGETLAFLRGLLGYVPEDCRDFFLVWTLNAGRDGRKEEKRSWWQQPFDLEQLAGSAAHLSYDWENVYFGVGLRSRSYVEGLPEDKRPYYRGGGDNVSALLGFSVDLDIAGDGHAKTALPATEEEARSVFRAFEYRPTLIVHTGGGLQAHWLFKEPWYLETPEERLQAADLSERVKRAVNAIAAERGWSVDACHDLARVMRLPGTLNRKNPDAPKLVRVVDWSGPRHNPSDFLDLPENLQEIGRDSSGRLVGKKYEGPAPDFDRIQTECGFFRHCVTDAAKQIPEPEWYALAQVLACCNGGKELFHAYSKPDPRYSEPKTEAKFLHALQMVEEGKGPFSCARIQSDHGDTYCRDCDHRGKIGNPVKLGRERWQVNAGQSCAEDVADLPMPEDPDALPIRTRPVVTPAARTDRKEVIEAPPVDVPPPPDEPPGGGKKSQATVLVELALEAGIELFRASDETCYATINITDRNGTHAETWNLDSKGFRTWLQRLFWRATSKVAAAQVIKDASNALAGIAFHDGQELPIYTRIGEHEGAIYINLCDSLWRFVKVTANGWEIVSNPPIKFRRPRGMLSLPIPERGGSLADLWPFVNVTKEQRILLAGWLAVAFRPKGPYPIAVIRGSQDSAKSTTTRVLKRLIDPNDAELRSEPKEERDLAIAAKNGWVIAFDNLPAIYPWLSNAFCRLATGAGFGTRQMYTDDEEALFKFQRPILLNGIGEIADKSDLLDRALLLALPPIEDARRKTEEEFWAEFEAAHPKIFGAILDALVIALRKRPSTYLESLPRMADFALWATAAETGFGFQAGEFIEAYEANREEAHGVALEASPIGSLIIQLVRGQFNREWIGTVSELLSALSEMVTDEVKKRKDWPKLPRSVSVELKKILPNLRAEGIEYEDWRDKSGRTLRFWVLNPASDSGVANGVAKSGIDVANGVANGFSNPTDRAHGVANASSVAKSPYISTCDHDWEKEGEERGEEPRSTHSLRVGEFATSASLRHQLREWAESNDWMVFQPRGGLAIGGDQAEWERWLHTAADGLVQTVWKGAMGA